MNIERQRSLVQCQQETRDRLPTIVQVGYRSRTTHLPSRSLINCLYAQYLAHSLSLLIIVKYTGCLYTSCTCASVSEKNRKKHAELQQWNETLSPFFSSMSADSRYSKRERNSVTLDSAAGNTIKRRTMQQTDEYGYWKIFSSFFCSFLFIDTFFQPTNKQ